MKILSLRKPEEGSFALAVRKGSPEEETGNPGRKWPGRSLWGRECNVWHRARLRYYSVVACFWRAWPGSLWWLP